MPFAHELSVLKVGTYYDVWHVEIFYHYRDKKYLVPVNPFLHKDPQFGADFMHYHIDGRFGISCDMRHEFGVKDGITNMAVIKYDSADDKKWHYEVTNLTVIKKKCLRLQTGVDPRLTQTPHRRNNFNKNKPTLYAIWYQTMIGKSCAGKKCPHLGTVMIDKGTHIECPMHKLIGSKKTEKIISITHNSPIHQKKEQ